MNCKNKRLGSSQPIQLLLASLVLLAPVASHAGDRFQGPYMGAYLGYVDGEDNGKEYHNGSPDGYTYENTAISGTVFGLLGGYNVRYGKGFVYGVEADYEGRSADKTVPTREYGVPDSDYPLKTELKEAGSIRGRLGYLFNFLNSADQTLVYATAGYAGAKIKRTYYDLTTPDSSSITSWQHGWTVGAGAEHFIKNQFSVRAEYRYAYYGRETVDVPVFGSGYKLEQEYDEHTFRVGLVYHFQ